MHLNCLHDKWKAVLSSGKKNNKKKQKKKSIQEQKKRLITLTTHTHTHIPAHTHAHTTGHTKHHKATTQRHIRRAHTHPFDDKTAYSTPHDRRSHSSVSGWRSPGRRRRFISKNTCCEAAAGCQQSPPAGGSSPPPLKNTDYMILFFQTLQKEAVQSRSSGCRELSLKATRERRFFLFSSTERF